MITDLYNLSYRRLETMQLPVSADDTSAQTVRLVVTKSGTTYIDQTKTFVNGEATLLVPQLNIPIGVYEYTLTITYSDGVTDILPDTTDCESGDCTLPKFTVCQSNLPGVVS